MIVHCRGYSHSLCIGAGNILWVFGTNESNQLCLSSTPDDKVRGVSKPKRVKQKDNSPIIVCSISSSYRTSAIVDLEGNLWIAGACQSIIGKAATTMPMQLNVPNVKVEFYHVCIGESCVMCVDISGNVWGIGKSSNGQLGLGTIETVRELTKIPNLSKIIEIKSGQAHTVALDEQGNVYSAGASNFGQLGLGKSVQKSSTYEKINNIPIIRSISCGWNHSLLLADDGTVLSFGCSYDGRLGHISRGHVFEPTEINDLPKISLLSTTYYSSLCIDESSSLWMFGDIKKFIEIPSDFQGSPLNTKISGVVDISEGGFCFFILNDSGEIWAFGDSSQLGEFCTDKFCSKIPEKFVDRMFRRSCKQKSARK